MSVRPADTVFVLKRDGTREPLDIEKIHRQVMWATEGLSGVSASEVEIRSQLQFYSDIKTVDIQETLIKAAADLIELDAPNYQYVAARLVNHHIRKEAYGEFEMPTLLDHVQRVVDIGFYTTELLEWYTPEEFRVLDTYIDHERDFDLTFAAMEQWRGKYLVKNRVSGQIYETPQMALMLIAATLFHSYSANTRMKYVKEYYDAISQHDISLPTPIMAGVRTPDKQFSSCVLIEADDSIDSVLGAVPHAITRYISQKAGIGVNIGRVRAIGSPVRGGRAFHTGIVPFVKHLESAVRSCADENTWVEIPDGKIQLKDLKPGMRVKSFDGGKFVFQKVLDIWPTIVEAEDRLILRFTNGTSLRCSVRHPIMVMHNDQLIQVLPRELNQFHEIVTENGSCYLDSIEPDTENVNYLDLEVENTNTFFASAEKNNPLILTHNCSQGGVRGGAATVFFQFWHFEFEDMVVLKNNKGTDKNRARHLDYCVQFNKLAYERLIQGGDLTLFSPSDVPGLYDAFFADQDQFKMLYEQYERDPTIRKKTIKAIDLFTQFMNERKNTGRIYFMNVDHVNSHGPYKPEVAPVRQSNLCLEICQAGSPLQDIHSEDPSISLCTLSAINWGRIREPKDFERPCRLAVRALDALLDYQLYPVRGAENNCHQYRNLGVGIINLAYWLARQGLRYSDDSSLATVDEYCEAWSYYMIRASVDLAKEKGACPGLADLKYSDGVFPHETRKADVDQLVPHQERFPWGKLREDLQQYGIRNATLMACMPSEASSLISNATNGIEPPRDLISIKQNKDFVVKQVVPESRRLKNRYELLWDQKSPEGYIKICAIINKWIDQSISLNTSYNPNFYPDRQLPMSELLRHQILMYKLGIRTGYYFNTLDGQQEVDSDQMIADNTDPDEESCEACTI
jgi:ribonucleoside-diphosphate reductase alpha subunit